MEKGCAFIGNEDISLVRYFDNNDRYADLMNGLIFHGRQVVTANALEEMDSRVTGVQKAPDKKTGKKFTQRYRDLVRKTVFGVNFVIIVVENQAHVHYAMPIRMMSESVKEYERQLKKIQDEHERRKDLKGSPGFLGKFSSTDKVAAVVSIVVYYGKEPWDGAQDLYEILDFTNIPEEMRQLVNHYPIHVLEVRRFENTEWFKTDLREVFEVIQHAENKKMLKDFVESCGERLDDMPSDACDVIAAVTGTREFAFKDEKYRNERGGIKMCQGMKDWLAEERALGHQEGHEEGRAEGRAEGHAEGHAEGRKVGHEEGHKEGRQEERLENVTSLFEYGMAAEEVSTALKIGLELVKTWYEAWDKARRAEVPA